MQFISKGFWFVILLPLLLFTSCNQETSELGNDFLDTRSNMALIDTITIKLSTFKYDSVPTSGRNLILCGNLNDANYGTITANSFFQIGTSSKKFLDSTDVNYYIYDSVSLVLNYSGYYLGDTTQYYEIKVNQLGEELRFKGESYELYNNSDFADKNEIGSIKFRPTPKKTIYLKKSINIKLNDDIGKDFFNMLYNKDKILENDEKFLLHFKGISLRSSSNSLVLGFNASETSTPSIRVHYRKKYTKLGVQYIEDLYTDFNLTNSYLQFNQFKGDYSGTKISGLLPQKKMLNSSNIGNSAYMLSGVGVGIKIEFPYIKKLQDASKYYRIMAANLVIEPLIRTYSYSNPLPGQMVLSQTDKNNEIGSVIVDNSNSSNAPNYGNLGTVDFLNPENNKYTYDITSYIYYLLNKSETDGMGLLFHSPNFYTSLDRIIIGDPGNQFNQISLKVYYVNYEE